MRRALLALAWLAFALDVAGVLFFLVWSLVASGREGERAYAVVLLVGSAVLLALGGAGLTFATRRRSTLGIAFAGAILALPCLIALVLWISDMFGL